jgi:hypothetical protein
MKTILNNNQIDQIISQTNQKYLDEENFTRELMDIDQSIFDNTNQTTENVVKFIDLNQITDYTFNQKL